MARRNQKEIWKLLGSSVWRKEDPSSSSGYSDSRDLTQREWPSLGSVPGWPSSGSGPNYDAKRNRVAVPPSKAITSEMLAGAERQENRTKLQLMPKAVPEPYPWRAGHAVAQELKPPPPPAMPPQEPKPPPAKTKQMPKLPPAMPEPMPKPKPKALALVLVPEPVPDVLPRAKSEEIRSTKPLQETSRPPKRKRRQRSCSPMGMADWRKAMDSEAEHESEGSESASSTHSRPRSSCSRDAASRIPGCPGSIVEGTVDTPKDEQIDVPEAEPRRLSEEERRVGEKLTPPPPPRRVREVREVPLMEA